tara:strand:- start:267 stop:1259 length:993 start_codon:yes stop_codon:yes gene_type:complete
MKQKILITGGAGYIGSHTCVELYHAGYTPIIVDNLCNTSIDNIKGIEKIISCKIKWYNINCCDINAMEKIFEVEKIIAVIHFAAFKSVEESVVNPEKYFTNNLKSLEVVLDCMSKYDVSNIIFSSSCTVYGTPENLPVKENEKFKTAESPYGETKQLGEKLLENADNNSISLRYFNPIGSHSSSLIGDCSADKPANLVPIITETAIGKRHEITIYGDDYNTYDGTAVRDYIHVEDLAIAHVSATRYIIKNSGKHAFNVGTGKGTSVLEAIKSFEKTNNIVLNYKIGERRKGDIEKIYADPKFIKDKLGWKAKKTLDDAMKSAWEWERNKK